MGELSFCASLFTGQWPWKPRFAKSGFEKTNILLSWNWRFGFIYLWGKPIGDWFDSFFFMNNAFILFFIARLLRFLMMGNGKICAEYNSNRAMWYGILDYLISSNTSCCNFHLLDRVQERKQSWSTFNKPGRFTNFIDFQNKVFTILSKQLKT